MTRPVHLVVPVHVLALCVNGTGVQPTIYGPSADFSGFPFQKQGSPPAFLPYLASGIQAFSEVKYSQPGVHLHWSLPDALMRGQHQPDQGGIVFPAVPNRWCVTRVCTGADGSVQTRRWLVNSDALSTDAPTDGSPTMPCHDPVQCFLYIGQVLDYDAPPSSSSGIVPFPGRFTTVGHGDVAFAAYYPNCRNVFGLFDDLGASHLEAGAPPSPWELTYSVMGWYSDPSQDPLAGSPMDGASNDYKWAFAGGVPEATICSGSVRGVSWDPAEIYFPETASVCDVALGNTHAEALSVLVAGQPVLKDDPDAEYLLNAVQQGLLTGKFQGSREFASFDLALHTKQFNRSAGGNVWSVRSAADGDVRQGETDSTDTGAVLPDPLAAALAKLNKTQEAYDRQQFACDSFQRQVFNDWYRDVVAFFSTATAPPVSIAAMQTLITAELDQYAAMQTAKGALTIVRGKHADTCSAATPGPDAANDVATAFQELLKLLPSGKYLVQCTPGPPFWSPADPVVLLRGEDVGPSLRLDGPADAPPNGYLPCRLSTEINDGLNYGQLTLPAGDITGGVNFTKLGNGLAEDAAALLAEAVLLDGRFTGELAAALCKLDSKLVEAQVQKDLDDLHLAMTTEQSTSVGIANANGTLAYASARTQWTHTPWNPVYLQWTLEYNPLAGVPDGVQPYTFSSDLITAHHSLNADAVELEMLDSVPPVLGSVAFQGFTTLTRSATAELSQELSILAPSVLDPELEDIRKHLPLAPMLSQAMSGVHNAMLQQFLTRQVDVFQPYTPLVSDPRLPPTIGNFNDAAPMSGSSDLVSSDHPWFFAPVRSGTLTLGSLTLVDSFGQCRTVQPSSAHYAHALYTDTGRLVLPPRVTQPSRLLFRWLDASTGEVQAGARPASSPICGWVIVNRVDNSLMLFDADGVALGELALIAGETSVVWRDAPGGFPENLETLPSNATLEAFRQGVLQGGAEYAREMMAALLEAGSSILPAEPPPDPRVALLMSRPLVLTRAVLELEARGIPNPDQGWQALLSDLNQPSPGNHDDSGKKRLDGDYLSAAARQSPAGGRWAGRLLRCGGETLGLRDLLCDGRANASARSRSSGQGGLRHRKPFTSDFLLGADHGGAVARSSFRRACDERDSTGCQDRSSAGPVCGGAWAAGGVFLRRSGSAA
ncbi:MAG: hypothetical protein M3Y50_15180 [Acidobacteriota bacterium]|nr:hypothetical protein [Acidobacteriota bacterium]